MKRFDELTSEQKAAAVNATLRQIIGGLMTGTVSIRLTHEMHQRVMTKMLESGRKTGDFSRFHTFVNRSAKFKQEVLQMAEFAAKDAYYTQPREFVLYNIAE